jgi:hypothetical protein
MNAMPKCSGVRQFARLPFSKCLLRLLRRVRRFDSPKRFNRNRDWGNNEMQLIDIKRRRHVVWYKMMPDSFRYRPVNVPRIEMPKFL